MTLQSNKCISCIYVIVLGVYILPLDWPCKIPQVYKTRRYSEGMYIILRKTVFWQSLESLLLNNKKSWGFDKWFITSLLSRHMLENNWDHMVHVAFSTLSNTLFYKYFIVNFIWYHELLQHLPLPFTQVNTQP